MQLILIRNLVFNDFHLYPKVFLPLDGGATYVDSDTGLESMSSAEATTKACSLCLDGVVASGGMMVPPEAGMQIDGLKQEVTRLKCDKLDLLRQNVVSKRIEIDQTAKCKKSILIMIPMFQFQTCQRDIKRLRERELSLQGDLAAAGKEILRLRDLLKEYMPTSGTTPHSLSPL